MLAACNNSQADVFKNKRSLNNEQLDFAWLCMYSIVEKKKLFCVNNKNQLLKKFLFLQIFIVHKSTYVHQNNKTFFDARIKFLSALKLVINLFIIWLHLM